MPGKSTMARLFLFILGLTAMATQVVMIREALTLFNGNELIIGLFLGLWMILTALGSFLGAKVLTVTGYGLRVSRYEARGSCCAVQNSRSKF